MQTILTARYKTLVYEAIDKKLRVQPAVAFIDGNVTDALELKSLPGCSA